MSIDTPETIKSEDNETLISLLYGYGVWQGYILRSDYTQSYKDAELIETTVMHDAIRDELLRRLNGGE